jgi:hypothetical protein
MAAPAPKKRKVNESPIKLSNAIRGIGAISDYSYPGTGLMAEGVAAMMDYTNSDGVGEPQSGAAGTSMGGGGYRKDLAFANPKFKHHFDVTVTKTTQVQLTDTGSTSAYFFPTSIYDWWLTEPTHTDTLDKHNYTYIPAYKDLLFYDTPADRKNRSKFFHFVEPLGGHVQVRDLLFFSDQAKDSGNITLATYGFETAYLMMGKRYLPEEPMINVQQPSGRYMSNVLFAKQTLPSFELNRPEAMDSHELVAIHGGSGFDFDVNFHKPLHGSQKFILPLAYKYAENNSSTYVNFTWLPMRNWAFRAFGDIKPVDEDGNAVSDARYLCNFSGNSDKGFSGPQEELMTPLHILFFPRIKKIDGTDFKIRCTFMMTTSARFRLYSKFPTHTTTCYNLLEAKLGQHYKYDSYQAFTKYPVSAKI